MEDVKCTDCGEMYSDHETVCPKCGSKRRQIFLEAKSELNTDCHISSARAKNNKFTGKKKIRWEWKSEDTVRRDDGKTRVHRFQSIDRDEDTYEEKVTDLETGEVIHECYEPLSDHRGHGSDKQNNV